MAHCLARPDLQAVFHMLVGYNNVALVHRRPSEIFAVELSAAISLAQ